jgi:hypothetical protein
MISRTLFLLGLLALFTGCAGGSDPRSTALSYIQALRQYNISGAESCLVVHGPSGTDARDMLVEVIVVPRQIDALCREKFGHDLPQGDEAKVVDDQTLDAAAEAVMNARVKLNDNTAYLYTAQGALDAVCLTSSQPAEKSVFGWRLIVDKYFDAKSQPADIMRKGGEGWVLRQNMNILRDVMKEIRSGKLGNTDEVITEIGKKSDEFVKANSPAPVQRR